MNEFGDLLRECRERSFDARTRRRLSQERMAELVGLALGEPAVSPQTLSNWESGRVRILARERLLAAIQVLCECGGLVEPAVADRLLWLATFRSLDQQERQRLFPACAAQAVPEPGSRTPGGPRLALFLLGEVIFEPSHALRRALGQTPGDWTGRVARVAGVAAGCFSAAWSWRRLQWMWLWLLAWCTTIPALRWPFPDAEAGLALMGLYVFGALTVPLGVGGLTRTRDHPFWQHTTGGAAVALRLYTHQGAALGFHLAYVLVVTAALIGHYLGWPRTLALELAAAALPLAASYIAARVVPVNLWTAYRRLALADGAVFFVFAAFGPLWATFFLCTQALLLQPLTGTLIILSALSTLAAVMARKTRPAGTGVIPAHG
jgi:transcriptional regulator with XRE-family HTH domain